MSNPKSENENFVRGGTGSLFASSAQPKRTARMSGDLRGDCGLGSLPIGQSPTILCEGVYIFGLSQLGTLPRKFNWDSRLPSFLIARSSSISVL